jgi:hypothetical protein
MFGRLSIIRMAPGCGPGLGGALKVTYIRVDHWVDQIRVLDECVST